MMKNEKLTDGQIIDSTAIGAAFNDLRRYVEPRDVQKAEKLADIFTDVIDPQYSTCNVAMAALMFARKALLVHKDAMAELEAEIEAREARIANNSKHRKAA